MKFNEMVSLLKAVVCKPLTAVPLPKHIQVDITTYCNLKCTMCYAKKIVPVSEHNTHMSLEQFVKILDAVRPLSVNMAANGEPFLNPAFFDMVSAASQRGIKTITSSNGIMSPAMVQKIAESTLDILKISIDGATKETYESMRGPHYDALMNTVDYLRNLLHEKHKKTPQLRFDLVITRKTYREIADFITFCISKGVHHAFFHPLDVREYDTQAQDALVRGVPIDELTSQLRDAQRRAARNGVSTNIPALLRNMHVLRRLHRGEPLSAMKRPVCVLPWLGMFVTVTGEVSPCCAMYPHGALSVGNLLTQDIDEVWNGSKMSTMRKSFKNLKNYQLYDGCAYCMPMSVASLVSAAKTFPGYIKELFKKHAAR